MTKAAVDIIDALMRALPEALDEIKRSIEIAELSFKGSKCGSCRYFDESDAVCRRHAPQPSPYEGVRGYWPHVYSDDWCGEWLAVIE